MRYNTGNPVGPDGSNSPFDLYDNSGIIDLLLTGPLGEYLDRLGVPLKSWRGIMQQVTDYLIDQGYESVYLTYGAGVVVERQTQLVQRAGELYRVMNASDIPLTLTGTWATDAPKLQAVGDAALRQALASSTGATFVHRGSSTVDADLTALEVSDAAQNVQLQKNTDALAGIGRVFSNVLDPAVVDLHYATQCGVGWSASDPGGIVSTATTAAAAQNTTALPVASSASFFVEQIICWLASDGQYYTGVIKAIEAGPVLRIDRQLRVAVASGAPVYNFNRDDAHANTYGFNAIADEALRQLGTKRISNLEYQGKDGAIWSPILGATLVSQTASVYTNPGSATIGERSISVASNSVGAGVASSWVSLSGGDKMVNIAVNPGTRDGGFSGSIDIAIFEKLADGTEFQIASDTGILSYGAIRSRDIYFTIRPGSMVQVRITSPNGGPWTFYVGPINYFGLRGFLGSLNRGKHVLLGDSWFAGGDLYNRLVARLPKATIINKGISGNKASDLLARFAADVIPQNPDFVWIMIGTNDYYASVTPNLFEQQILQLRRMIQALGAQPIFFTASVGAIAPTAGGGDQLVKSRGYAINVRYHAQALQPDGAGTVARSANFYARATISASSSQIIGVIPGMTRLPALVRFLHQSVAGLQLSIEYCAAADGTGAVDVATYTGVGPFKDQPTTRSNTELRFVVLRATNPTGSSITASIIADICWNQSVV
ncbi:GDSL-type esterase/lipase family protein [Pseudomonas asiatica]|uniref:GDSL-type esterase/lipase family protein n=1 Tax=Pseudomonas asiatica TaxID=2219225 RepID=UPI0014850742|nr:GDSL-type esterase/lipase family protein [Pseudomonas asiatica]MCO8261469.1 GDSL-type esterase/lipase family protein [Pseudomonas asiatica]